MLTLPPPRPLWLPSHQPTWAMLPQQQQRSFHRVCCCGCPAEVEVTFAGIDGNPCGCVVDGVTSRLWANLTGADGTFTLPLISTAFDICTFQATFSGTLDEERFANTTCTAPPASAAYYTQFLITVVSPLSTGKVREVYIQGVGAPTGNAFSTGAMSPQADFGSTINNRIKCDGTGVNSKADSGCGVGTAVVIIP